MNTQLPPIPEQDEKPMSSQAESHIVAEIASVSASKNEIIEEQKVVMKLDLGAHKATKQMKYKVSLP